MLPDPTIRDLVLDWSYGAVEPPRSAWHDVALYDEAGDELDDATAPGYDRVRVEPEDWPPAANGQKTIHVTFPSSTDAWVPVVSWALIGDDGRTWDTGDLLDPIVVTAASPTGPELAVTVSYETDIDDLIPPEPDPETDPEDVDPEVYVEPDDGDDDGSESADPDVEVDPDDDYDPFPDD